MSAREASDEEGKRYSCSGKRLTMDLGLGLPLALVGRNGGDLGLRSDNERYHIVLLEPWLAQT